MRVGAWAGGRDVFAEATAATKVTPKFWGRPLNKEALLNNVFRY